MSIWAYMVGGILVIGSVIAWVVYRHEQAFYTLRSEGEVIHPEEVLEAFLFPNEDGDMYLLYELVRTREGYVYRCSDVLSEETLWEGSGRRVEDATRAAQWDRWSRE